MKLEINKENRNMLILLIIFAILYTSCLVYCQTIRGVSYWDIFVYLQNAMLFSNHNIGSQLGVPPVLSLFIAIPFSLGFISETSMFVVSGILFIFLMIGIYLLFCEKFSPRISFVGTLIFSMLSLVVTWAVTGSNDLPALCFSVWAMYFTIKAVHSDFKYYYPAFICFVIAFFTRFTEGFILLVMLSYMLINFDIVRKQLTRKNILKISSFILVVCAIIAGIYLFKQGTIPFISQFLEVSSSNQVSTVNVGYNLNPWYYIQNLPELLSSWNISSFYDLTLSTVSNEASLLSYVFLLFIILGLISFVIRLFGKPDSDIEHKNLKCAIILVLGIFTLISYTHISYILTELLFIMTMLLLYKFDSSNISKMDLIMILWVGVFIILHSYHPVKVDRYIVPIFIPLIYFMIEGIQYFLSAFKINNKRNVLIVLTILLVILVPINISYIESLTHENPHTHEELQASIWLENYDSNLENINISADRGVVFSWYLKKYTYTTIPRVLQSTNESLVDKLNSINAKYYIDSSSGTQNIRGYHEIYNNNKTDYKLKIYERN